MAANKYLSQSAGVIQEVQAKDFSAGAGDSGKLVALDATGKLDSTMMPVGMGAETDTFTASENLAAGDFVNIWSDTGTAKARKADATTSGKYADGFVLSAVTLGNPATVYRSSQTNTQLSGLTPGSRYYLHTTAGTATSTPPSGSGNVVQALGVAKSATELVFEPRAPIVLA